MTVPNEHTRLITVNTGEGEGEVVANVRGALAVHETPNTPGSWTVTHVPTGMLLAADFDHASMLALRDRLAHLDWAYTSRDAMPDHTRARSNAIMNAWSRGDVDDSAD